MQITVDTKNKKLLTSGALADKSVEEIRVVRQDGDSFSGDYYLCLLCDGSVLAQDSATASNGVVKFDLNTDVTNVSDKFTTLGNPESAEFVLSLYSTAGESTDLVLVGTCGITCHHLVIT